MNKIFQLIFLILIFASAHAQKLVTFKANDGLEVTADYYETENESNRYFLLFHQAEYSRGEHKEIGRKLIKLGYNCLAVDLRSGGEVNYVQNETAISAKKKGMEPTMFDAWKDIEASIIYIKSIDENAEIYLFGSSYSASLCLIAAKKRNDIKAVVAFSPGEFFQNKINVESEIEGLNIPMFVACPQSEFNYVKKLVSKVDKKKLTLFKPQRGDGLHGAKTLWWESSTSNEFWLALFFFLKDFQPKDED